MPPGINLYIILYYIADAAMLSQTTGRSGHGLIGYGITIYHLPCEFACRPVLSSSSPNSSMNSVTNMSSMNRGR